VLIKKKPFLRYDCLSHFFIPSIHYIGDEKSEIKQISEESMLETLLDIVFVWISTAVCGCLISAFPHRHDDDTCVNKRPGGLEVSCPEIRKTTPESV
jgi:hypothetical protein